jgi:hypothetical protein
MAAIELETCDLMIESNGGPAFHLVAIFAASL